MHKFMKLFRRTVRLVGINLNWVMSPVTAWQRREPFLMPSEHRLTK